MKIKKAVHCRDMQIMLNDKFTKFYIATLCVWCAIIIILLLIVLAFKHDKIKIIKQQLKITNDGTLITYSSTKKSYNNYTKEWKDCKFTINTTTNSDSVITLPHILHERSYNTPRRHTINKLNEYSNHH